MIIDMHSSFRPEFVPPKEKLYEKITEKEYLNKMKEGGVDISVMWFITSVPDDVGRLNDWISATMKKHPDKIIGFGVIYPPHGKKALDEVDRAITKLGLKGIKLHPPVQGYRMNDPSVLDVLDRAREYDVPTVIHVTSPAYRPFPDHMGKLMQEIADLDSKFSKSAYLADIVPHYNSRKFFAAHLGGIYDAKIEQSKISFQTTGACVSAIEYAYRAVGPERIVYGSDYPFFEPADEVSKVQRARIPDDAKRRILEENARQVLKL